MKKYFLIFISIFLVLSRPVFAVDRMVSSFFDELKAGTLRSILQFACEDAGDDDIYFVKTYFSEWRIKLKAPLVIPGDCNGKIILHGSTQVQTLLDASLMETDFGYTPGETCSLDVYSNGNTIENIAFVGNQYGAGICLFGKDNLVEDNQFVSDTTPNGVRPNHYGVVVSGIFSRSGDRSRNMMNGTGNKISHNVFRDIYRTAIWVDADAVEIGENEIIGNGEAGIRISGSDSSVSGNTIMGNGGCFGDQTLASQTVPCRGSAGFPGILVVGGSSDIIVSNTIQYNRGGGVDVVGDAGAITITQNRLSNNYQEMLGIDLGDDGLTPNDVGDTDVGPNTKLNFMDYFQSFPLVPSPSGKDRFWSWGLVAGDHLEFYTVSADDIQREVGYGGGDEYLGEALINDDNQVSVEPDKIFFKSGDVLTSLTFDGLGNTSEFSANTLIGPDADLDGIVDALETGNGFRVNKSSQPLSTDTDQDGLPDSIEDKNRNGEWDSNLGETSTYKKDSDGDGLNDWVETRGDGVYNPGRDTDPLNPDTDGDGISDGGEDKNHDGIWNYNETGALTKDSDGDGFSDLKDTCPGVANPDQSSWVCQI